MPKYLLLVTFEPGVVDSPMDEWQPEEITAHLDYYRALNASLAANGDLVDVTVLTPPDAAHVVRSDGTAPVVTEGPFQEFKEWVAGFQVVDVDTEIGKVVLRRHIAVDDAGRILNPLLADGQRHGGIAQGAAQALLEEVRYDEDGNPVTSNLADYAAISATELPSFELVAMETPTTANPLGVKGIGESGTIGSTPAVQSAVIDALAHLGVRHLDMPLTPERVWRAIQSGPGGAS